jgi:hypothetical protein
MWLAFAFAAVILTLGLVSQLMYRQTRPGETSPTVYPVSFSTYIGLRPTRSIKEHQVEAPFPLRIIDG